MDNQSNTEEIAAKVAADFFASTTSLTSKWKTELDTLMNISIPQNAVDGVVLEDLFFAYFLMHKITKSVLDESEREVFLQKLKQTLIYYLATLYFSSKEKDPQKNEQIIADLFNNFLGLRIKAYSEYNEGTTVNLFKEFILRAFNENDYKIKFYKNSFKNRLLIKTAFIMGGSSAPFAKDKMYDDKLLDGYVAALFQAFNEPNIERLILETRQ